MANATSDLVLVGSRGRQSKNKPEETKLAFPQLVGQFFYVHNKRLIQERRLNRRYLGNLS